MVSAQLALVPVPQAKVTPAMTAWAKELRDRKDFPIGSSEAKDFGGTEIVGRAERHTWIGATGEQRPDGIRGISLYYGDPDDAADEPRLEGIDISNYQSKIDWPTVGKSGVKFAFIKATEGATNTDKSFESHWKGAGSANLARGAYHFFRASSTPKDQIDHFLSTIGDRAQELPPVLDVEWQNEQKALGDASVADFSADVIECLSRLATSTGRRPILYTAPGFWSLMPDGFGAQCAALADLWIAHYGVSSTTSLPGWGRWAFWQYSSTKLEPGVTSKGDANVFCGGLDDFEQYLSEGTLPAPDPSTPIGLQMSLNMLGTQPPLAEDGVIGPKTTSALMRFQAAQGLERSGHVDPATTERIKDLLLANDSSVQLGGDKLSS